jgi:methylated-DNA-[protein]-cysteine S-methyltransferase
VRCARSTSSLCARPCSSDSGRGSARSRSRPAATGGCAGRLHAYFEGALDALDAVLVDPGGTPFQRQVWSALRTIPPGTTVTYTTLAKRLGQPRAIRAVGLANSRNPISLVIPCHRVIGAGGHLTGYGGGIWRKRWLLEHEGACGGRAVGNR